MILVTGGNGLIGQDLLPLLVSEYGENKVINISRTPSNIPGVIDRVHDLTQPIDDGLFELGWPITGIIHLAAAHNVFDSLKRPDYYYQLNITTTTNILAYAVRHKVKFFINASTGMVYQSRLMDSGMAEESDLGPSNPYARSKLICEGITSNICQTHKINHVNARIFNAVGTVSPADSVRNRFMIPNIINAIRSQTPFEVYKIATKKQNNSVTTIRDYIHTEDIANALVKLANVMNVDFGNYITNHGFTFERHAVNIGTGKGTSVLDLIEIVQEVTGKDMLVKLTPYVSVDPYYVANSKLMESIDNWEPRIDIKEMISRQWRMYNEQ